MMLRLLTVMELYLHPEEYSSNHPIFKSVVEERKSLAYCSKDIYQVMKPFLWRRLKLCARHIVSYHREKILKNIHRVRDLTLNYDGGDAKKIKTFGIFLIRIFNCMNLSSLLPDDDVSEDHFTQLMSKSLRLQVLHLHKTILLILDGILACLYQII